MNNSAQSRRVVFLDYDDVVNKPMWTQKDGKWVCRYNFPRDNAVNDVQAVQWVSEFCQKFGYSIVVSSSWRTDGNYKECLINAGLREGISIDGRTPSSLSGETRGQEISEYLRSHPEIECYLIFDDMPPSEFEGHEGHFLWVKHGSFGIDEYSEACRMHDDMLNIARREHFG